MRAVLLALALFCSIISAQARVVTEEDLRYVPRRIAFGSCNIQLLPQDHWQTVIAREPDLWIWLGDIIYADLTASWLREFQYQSLYTDENYVPFRQRTPIIGTWDDHDYGQNNIGATYGDKVQSQRLILNFLEEPRHSPRRTQQGIYTSYTFGIGERRLRVILLDERFFRQPEGQYSDILGATQWAWLENQLLNTPNEVELTLIGSSSQIVPIDNGDTWRHYPQARARMMNLIERSMTQSHRIVVLSGDRHFAELNRTQINGMTLYEATASGLTHTSVDRANEFNRYRIGRAYHDKNFGMLELDWNQYPVGINFQIWTVEGQLRQSINSDPISRPGR